MELKETVTFKDLGLSEAVLKAIEDSGYKHPTPIQEQAIPIVLMCRDVPSRNVSSAEEKP